jgi:hypothetical protein
MVYPNLQYPKFRYYGRIEGVRNAARALGERGKGNSYLINGASEECVGSKGAAGIHFPHTPFSSRRARAVLSFCRACGAAVSRSFVQNGFVQSLELRTKKPNFQFPI